MSPRPRAHTQLRCPLSPREREIVELQRSGLCHKEIAVRLGIALATVKTHFTRAFQKTGVRNSLELQQRIRCRDCGRLQPIADKIKRILAMSDHFVARGRIWPPFS